jgi:hypothetical protein
MKGYMILDVLLGLFLSNVAVIGLHLPLIAIFVVQGLGIEIGMLAYYLSKPMILINQEIKRLKMQEKSK